MSRKQVGIKAIGWLDDEGMPVLRLISALPDQESLIKAFIGVKVEIREVDENSIELVGIQEEKPSSETVPLQSMSREELLVNAAKLEIQGVDGRTSKPNIIAAIRKNANAAIED